MSGSNGSVVDFQQVDCGDMSEIPPDLPAGEWTAVCAVKKSATSKDKFPMLILEWKTLESNDDANEEFVGGRSSDFLVFYPASHRATRMQRQRMRTMCEALGLEVPAATSIRTWDDLGEFIAELDGKKATIYTTVQTGKDGERRTRIEYRPQGASLASLRASAEDSADEESDDGPKTKAPAKSKRVSR